MGIGAGKIFEDYSSDNRLKKLLIISPYFAPVNTADMQRVRMSLPYFYECGWEPTVVTVNPDYTDLPTDALLIENIPSDVKIYRVKAFSKKWTSKFGLGSIALRSLWFYKQKVNQLLKAEKFDLIYFSTTQFPALILGAYWKKKFKIPYVIDMQDPWFSTYYEDQPKAEKPAKYWFSHRLDKYLEPVAIKNADGLISVSQGYLDTLNERYPMLKSVPQQVITFGAYQEDFDLVQKKWRAFELPFQKNENLIHVLYIGRGGYDMKDAVTLLFDGFKKGLIHQYDDFKNLRFHFIGTSYAPAGTGIKTIQPIADEMGISEYVEEQTDRIPFYQGIFTLLNADGLLVIGSNDQQYTASKIYPYILARKPLLAFLHKQSSAAKIIQECGAGKTISINEEPATEKVRIALYSLRSTQHSLETNWNKFEKYSARNLTKQQCDLFDKILNN